MSERASFAIQPATVGDAPELAALFDAYRVFYRAASMPSASEAFVRGLVERGQTRFFLAREAGKPPALGFVHLMPSIATVAMRPAWLLEDLYVAPEGRRRGVAAALMRHAENFGRESGAERLTLATAHDNRDAQALYQKMGYLREEHFQYFHRLLD